MKQGINNVGWNTQRVIVIETNSYKHNQEHFLLFQVDDFSAMQCVVLTSQRLVLLERISPFPPLHRPEWCFLLNLPSLSRRTLLVKRGINTRSKDRIYIQLIIFPRESKIVLIRHLMPAGVHILCIYTWEDFVSHLHSHLLVKGNWNLL